METADWSLERARGIRGGELQDDASAGGATSIRTREGSGLEGDEQAKNGSNTPGIKVDS